MSSDHFHHHVPHFHHAAPVHGPAAGLVAHTESMVLHHAGVPEADASISNFTDRVDTASNLSAALTGHYQSLIEGHAASIKPG